MARTRWYQERQREGYYRLAKREGYRARSAYKLQQVNEKYGLVKPGNAVADLGAAPGGWSQVLVETVGAKGLVLGVDLQRIKPIPGARFMQGDFTRRETREKLAGILADSGRRGLDAVVSDMAPDMSGNYELDQVRSVQLAELALDFARQHLRKGGHFVCKVFEGADFQAFRNEVRTHFRSLYQFHPPASRKSSSEIYLVGKGFKGGEEGPAAQAGEGATGSAGPDRAEPVEASEARDREFSLADDAEDDD